MTVHFKKSFVKDLNALEPSYRSRVERTIRELEAAATLRDVRRLKKLQGRSAFSEFEWVIIDSAWPSLPTKRPW